MREKIGFGFLRVDQQTLEEQNKRFWADYEGFGYSQGLLCGQQVNSEHPELNAGSSSCPYCSSGSTCITWWTIAYFAGHLAVFVGIVVGIHYLVKWLF